MSKLKQQTNHCIPVSRLAELHLRPGVLFRRAHQIAVSLFVEECAALGLTPPQHSSLVVIANCPGLSQAEVARALGFDRATTGKIVQGLVERGLVDRSMPARNKRDCALEITRAGRTMLANAEQPIGRISKRLLSPLSADEQKQLIHLMVKVTTGLNASSRTPVVPPRGGEQD